MIDFLEMAVDHGRTLGADYVELRGESGFLEFLQMDDYRVTALTQRIEEGVAIRVLKDGAWGFVTTGDLAALNDSVETAYRMAKSAAPTRKEPITLASVSTYSDSDLLKVERDPRTVPVEEKIQYMRDLTKVCMDYNSRIKAVTSKIRTASGRKHLVTSDGTNIETSTMLVWSYPWVTGKDGDRLSAARYEEASTSQGWEYIEKEATPEHVGGAAAKRVKLQLDGVPAKGGSFPCVLGPRVIGVLAHEALGHLAEADLTINSAFNNKLGEVVASEGVNMVDDGTLPGVLGTSKYDDEGVPSSRVEIIKDSILTELLTNREYSHKLGLRTTGNARAESYMYPPLIRMRNTFFERGDLSEEELLHDIKYGYYCADFRGGQAQTNASFQVGIQEAYEIINGEIAGSVRDLSISGIATDSLLKIAGVGKRDFAWEAGRCGKGQEAFVASGGPPVRFIDGGIIFGGQA